MATPTILRHVKDLPTQQLCGFLMMWLGRVIFAMHRFARTIEGDITVAGVELWYATPALQDVHRYSLVNHHELNGSVVLASRSLI